MSRGESHVKWEKENIKRILLKVRLDDPILPAMEKAIASGLVENQTALIREAIREWLDKHTSE